MRGMVRLIGMVLIVTAVLGGIALLVLPAAFPESMSRLNQIEQALVCNVGERLVQEVEASDLEDGGTGYNIYSNCVAENGTRNNVNLKLAVIIFGLADLPALAGSLLLALTRTRRANTVVASISTTTDYPVWGFAGATVASIPNKAQPYSYSTTPLLNDFLSKKQVLAIPDLFMLKQEHRRFLDGQTNTFRTASSSLGLGCSLMIMAPFLIIGLGSLYWAIHDGGMFPLMFGGIFLAVTVFAVPVMLWASLRNGQLSREGQLLLGKVVGSTWNTDDEGRRVLSVRYTFCSPSGQQLTPMESYTPALQYIGMKRDPIPAPGTPVAVLYVHDGLYAVL